jgi:methionyl-tRNA synthetase
MKFYLTSAIPYVNAAPHIGHAQEFVYADVIRRYHTLCGEEVRYVCGADENALKIVQAAERVHQDPQAFTDIHQKEFLDLAEKLNVSFDVWQRGTDRARHFPASQKLWKLCAERGDIYKKQYTGLYCVGCESYYEESELDKNGECFEHPGKKLDRVSEENYFFRLSRYQKFLNDLLEKDTLAIIPDFRKNEAVSFLRKGLKDFSISRTKKRARGWGVPVPDDPDHIMYVWFDALNIYQTGIGFGWDDAEYKKWTPQDVMVIGKGILRFHALFWPAILKSAGLPVPKKLFVHGYLTVDGQKMSKTVGNIVDPNAILEKYGTDALRYYLLREIPSFSDGDFSERRFKEVYTADLANGLGNLIARVAKLASDIKTPLDFARDKQKSKIKYEEENTGEYKNLIEEFRFNDALTIIWSTIKETDRYINEKQPWTVNEQKLSAVLKPAIHNILSIATLLNPFLPETAEKILDQFKGPKIMSQPPLFPRLK